MYLPLNTIFDEKISIGLIMSSDEGVLVRTSLKKLAIIKSILSPKRYSFLKNYLKSANSDLEKNPNKLNFSDINSLKWTTENYINYLSTYSSNQVKFSEPIKIEMVLSKENFSLLYNKYVFEFEEDDFKDNGNYISTIKSNLYVKIESNVNIEAIVRPIDFSELLAPVEVDFIGKNGRIVAGQTLDFDKKAYYLESDLARFVSLTKAADIKEHKEGKYFVVGNEPDKRLNPKNHKTWEHIRDSKFLTYVNPDETEQISEYMKQNEVVPYFEEKLESQS
jgi:hypothetical protein